MFDTIGTTAYSEYVALQQISVSERSEDYVFFKIHLMEES